MRHYLLIFLLFFSVNIFAQFSDAFQLAYKNNPVLPKGILESVAWCNTRIHNLTENEESSCIGIPQAIGVMGLFNDGKGYFHENTKKVASLSGNDILYVNSSPEAQINAFARAFALKYTNYYSLSQNEPLALYKALYFFSEIPDTGFVNFFAKQSQIYQYLITMNDEQFAAQHRFTPKNYDLKELFGDKNFKVLSSSLVLMSSNEIKNEEGVSFEPLPSLLSADYGPALWAAAPSCNFSGRSGTAISAITIHTIQGSYAGAISWSQNCNSNVSFHYVIRSSDGQITQMVLEKDKGWHVGSENPYTIGYEHEGWVNQTGWYTEAMYQASAALTRNICSKSYGIPPLRTYYGAATTGVKVLGGCTKIKGHQHYPNQTHTDPGINWDWEKYYKLVNNSPSIVTISATSGTFFDSGGNSGNYSNDERMLWLFQPSNVSNVTLSFTAFDIETDWDYMLIYDGATTNAPLIGKYTGTISPGTVVGSNGALLVEFRSDCATVKSGWAATFSSTASAPIIPPVTTISDLGNWKTGNFTTNFKDSSISSTIEERYFVVADRQNASEDWLSPANQGFVNSEFEFGNNGWNAYSGVFTRVSNKIVCDEETSSNTNYSKNVTQNTFWKYLYHFKLNMNGGLSNQRAGIHFFNSDASQTNRGNSYFVYLRTNSDKVQIYKVENNVFSLEMDDDFIIDPNIEYDVKITYDPVSGWIKVYVDGVLATSWQDSNPITSGSSISLRTAETKAIYDDVRVYRNRANTATITVGAGQQMRYESNASVPSGRIYAISKDSANWSNLAFKDYYIDYSPPTILNLNKGLENSSPDTIYTPIIAANWQTEDLQSGIDNIEYAVGTSFMAEDAQTRISVSNIDTSFSQIMDSLEINKTYYVKLRVTNGAGLNSESSTTGQFYTIDETIGLDDSIWSNLLIFPNPSVNEVNMIGLPLSSSIQLFDISGKKLLTSENHNTNHLIQLINYPSGVYLLVLSKNNSQVLRKLIKK